MATESQRGNGYVSSVEVQRSFSWRNNPSSLSRTGTSSPWRNATDLLSKERKHLSLEEQHVSPHRLHTQVGYSEKGLESCQPAKFLTAEAPALREQLREE